MLIRLLAIAAFLLPAFAVAQEVKLPAEIRGKPGEFVVIIAETADPQVRWWSIDGGLNLFPAQLLKDSKTAVVTALVPGRYRVLAVSAKGDVPSAFAHCWVTIGDPVVVVPPVIVPPDPTPPPVVTGPRGVVLIRESSSQSTRLADVVRDLRNPASVEFKYLKDRGHSLAVIDPDQIGADGKALIEPWRAVYAGLSLPVVVVYHPTTRNVLVKETIPTDSSDPKIVLDLVKKGGG